MLLDFCSCTTVDNIVTGHTPPPSQTYDLGEMAALAGLPGGLVIGAGAGSSKVAGVNCEVSKSSLSLSCCTVVEF